MIAGRQLSLNILYRAGNMATVFGLTLLMTKLCGVGGYGLFSLLLANVALFSLFSSAGSDAGITFHVAAGDVSLKALFRFTVTIVFIQVVAAVLADMVAFLVTGHPFFLRGDPWNSNWPGLLLFTTVAINEKCNAWLLGRKEYTLANHILFFSNVGMLLYFLYESMEVRHPDPYYYLRAWAVLSLFQTCWMIAACIQLFRESKSAPVSMTKPVRIYTYSLFTFVINTIQFLAYRIDFWILEHYKGEMQLGWYALAARLSQLLWVLPLLLASIIFPHAASGADTFREDRLRSWLRLMNGLNILAGIILVFAASWLIPILFGNAYQASVQLFRILLPGVILFGMATLLAAYFGGRNMLTVNLWGSVLCLTVTGTLDLILIPLKGMHGAALASTIGYGATGIYFLIRYALHSGIPVHTLLIPRKGDLDHLNLRSIHATT